MSDSDNPPYTANGSGGGRGRAELRSMPFFPAPPGSPTAPPTLPGAPVAPPPTLPGALAAPPAPQGIPLGAPPAPVTPALQPAAAPSAPAAPAGAGRHSQPAEPAVLLPATTSAEETAAGGADDAGPAADPTTTVVQGRIKIEDQVLAKIAALAALEVTGVVRLDAEGITVQPGDDEIALDLTMVVEYGSVVLEVARTVQQNVGASVALMLGIRVGTVNVTVADVHLPETGGGQPAPA